MPSRSMLQGMVYQLTNNLSEQDAIHQYLIIIELKSQ